MDHRLVETATQILRSFSSNYDSNVEGKTDQFSGYVRLQQTSLGFNELLKREKTSKDRVHVQNVRNYLLKTGLLTMEGKWRQGKKQHIRLTALGVEILGILENIDRFKESKENFMRSVSGFTEYLKARLEKYPKEADLWKTSKDKKESVRALLNMGLTREEVVQVSNTQFVYLFVGNFLDVGIFLSLLQSYMHTYYAYYPSVTKDTEDILIEIILNEMHKQLKVLHKQPFFSVMDGEILEHNVNQTVAGQSESLFGSSIERQIDEIIDPIFYFDIPSSIMRQEIHKSFLSLLNITKFSSETILGWQKSFRNKIEEVQKIRSLSNEMKEKGNSLVSQALEMNTKNVNINNLRELDDICEKYLSLKKMDRKSHSPMR
jgi:hypothetical protein